MSNEKQRQNAYLRQRRKGIMPVWQHNESTLILHEAMRQKGEMPKMALGKCAGKMRWENALGTAYTQSLAPQEGRHNECLPGLLGRKFIVVY